MKNRVLATWGLVAGTLGAVAAPGAHAQDFSGDILRCGAIADNPARLACFDELPAKARQGQADADASSKADFGLSAAQRSERGKRDAPETVADRKAPPAVEPRVEASIAAVDMDRFRAVFTLDNGQIWQTTSFGTLNTVPRVGQKVVVQTGPLGGYRLTLAGKTNEIGVKRVK